MMHVPKETDYSLADSKSTQYLKPKRITAAKILSMSIIFVSNIKISG